MMDKDDKVIDLFSKVNRTLTHEELEQIKFFEGFHYVKLNKDKNNKKFNASLLKKYAEGCHYIVRVMREVNGEVWMYNYDGDNAYFVGDVYLFIDGKQACKLNDMNYSTFMHGLKLAGIDMNRKMLSELAIHDAAAFTALTEKAKAAL